MQAYTIFTGALFLVCNVVPDQIPKNLPQNTNPILVAVQR
jgi:hypothetical protein